jgi:hypothetical protein
MSKIKSPQLKKAMSYGQDRRNTFGENSKASRKNIPLGKARSLRAERRSATTSLRQLPNVLSEDVLTAAELSSTDKAKQQRLRGFKKTPDTPLLLVLERRRLDRHRREQQKTKETI